MPGITIVLTQHEAPNGTKNHTKSCKTNYNPSGKTEYPDLAAKNQSLDEIRFSADALQECDSFTETILNP